MNKQAVKEEVLASKRVRSTYIPGLGRVERDIEAACDLVDEKLYFVEIEGRYAGTIEQEVW